jgi:antitoxin MazE
MERKKGRIRKRSLPVASQPDHKKVKRYTLEELLAGITDENRHPEWDTGPPVGKEIW